MCRTLQKNELQLISEETAPPHTINTVHANRVRLRTKGKERASRRTAAAVCGTSTCSIRQVLPNLFALVTCYPVYRLRPAFVNYVPPPERMRQTKRNKQSRLAIHEHDEHGIKASTLLTRAYQYVRGQMYSNVPPWRCSAVCDHTARNLDIYIYIYIFILCTRYDSVCVVFTLNRYFYPL